MQCDYFDAGLCRSCTLMGVPHEEQVRDKQGTVAAALDLVAPDVRWLEPWVGPEAGFRNKAKLVVGGVPGDITLGILGRDGAGIDLQGCGLYPAPLARSFPVLKEMLDRLQVPPYDVPRRRGELKHLIITLSPRGELMVRFVLRSRRHLPRLHEALPRLQAALPAASVVSVNLQPEHKAILEGPEEVVLTERRYLVMDVASLPLRLGPGGFFQTQTSGAAALYETAKGWVGRVGPASVLDLYCGVGGFALAAAVAAPHAPVHGVEVSAAAVRSARATADELGLRAATFTCADAGTARLDADLVVVNPPRRGIGDLTERIDSSPARWVIYSSCNVDTLTRDIAAMPAWSVLEARLVDMFPQTRHHEVVALLRRGQTVEKL
ncbi:23S rRNA (uracil(747)-C(5))-methyltransferase RlmC [Marihabitans asiaticum]|uniref:23S rRNA (Uracil747-C5)-methyltransferase n=1 Tax=Marihabitans asiaticum TaxID=415218 RepID=A0A560W6J7_9MICO|nr:methyltransferase [Marihabitans asiaticum]TWD13240.1 23S rRNA (uracil747-C5)-methyltransferase [Marihabitans asiaticum]